MCSLPEKQDIVHRKTKAFAARFRNKHIHSNLSFQQKRSNGLAAKKHQIHLLNKYDDEDKFD